MSFHKETLSKDLLDGDGDQSPVSGQQASEMLAEIHKFGDYLNVESLSEFHQDVVLGYHEEVARCFGIVGIDFAVRSRCNEPFRFTCLHLVVYGKQVEAYNKKHMIAVISHQSRIDHIKVAKLLLKHGANVNAKDYYGFTPLHRATSGNPQLEIAKLLIEAGADVNSRNRMGLVPLHQALMCKEFESCKLLLDSGADPECCDNDGLSVLQLSWTAFCIPSIRELIWNHVTKSKQKKVQKSKKVNGGEGEEKEKVVEKGAEKSVEKVEKVVGKKKENKGEKVVKAKAEKVEGKREGKEAVEEEEEVGSKICGNCGKGGGEAQLLKCNNCRSQYYCNVKCQKTDWKYHKLQCLLLHDSSYVSVTVTATVKVTVCVTPSDPSSSPSVPSSSPSRPLPPCVSEEHNNCLIINPRKKEGDSFIVKVQVNLYEGGEGPMHCSDQTERLRCYILPQDPNYDRIWWAIRKEGWKGLKGYFKAFFFSKVKLAIRVDKILPLQPW